ncbi:MAG: acyl-CoA dehydrogenase family protein [Acidimicrobiales bacterium]
MGSSGDGQVVEGQVVEGQGVEGQAVRDELRAWLAAHPEPSASDLAEGGWVAPHWPAPWGRGAGADEQLAIEDELARAGVTRPDNPIALGWAGPTIVAGGTPEQQRRWLPGILDGSEQWCQLFSEPEAGSDLAALRTRAERDGDRYLVNGQKIWSTWADRSDWGILLARTDPDAPAHRGISYFVVDMRSPGIEVRPIIEMTGGNHFNETFLTDVVVPVDQRIGAENEGWSLAKVTLGNERVSLSEGGVLWGMGPTSEEALAHLRGLDLTAPVVRQRFARLHTEALVIRLLGSPAAGDPGALASVRKAIADEHGQHVMGLVKDLGGATGMLGVQDETAEEVDEWHWGYLFSRALTIGGGTSEVQRNIIAEQLLGLPREPRP